MGVGDDPRSDQSRAAALFDSFVSDILHEDVVKPNVIIINAFINLKCFENNEYKCYA